MANVEIFSVSRSKFNKSGKCVHTHTLNFTCAQKAHDYVQASKRIDHLYANMHNRPNKWDYSLQCKSIY